MGKFKIGIQLIETYNHYVVVDAKDLDEAIEKVDKAYHTDNSPLYDATVNCLDEQEVRFFEYGLASKNEIKVLDNLDNYEL